MTTVAHFLSVADAVATKLQGKELHLTSTLTDVRQLLVVSETQFDGILTVNQVPMRLATN